MRGSAYWSCAGIRLAEVGAAIVRTTNNTECRNDSTEILLANQTSTMKLANSIGGAHHTKLDTESIDLSTDTDTSPIATTMIVYSHRDGSMWWFRRRTEKYEATRVAKGMAKSALGNSHGRAVSQIHMISKVTVNSHEMSNVKRLKPKNSNAAQITIRDLLASIDDL